MRSAALKAALCALALWIALALASPCAFADVRASDEILDDYTVEASGAGAALFPNVDANFALLTDESGTVFFSRNDAESTRIASITKIMTAMVAMERSEGISDVTVSEKAAAIGESTAGLKAGDKLSFSDALFALMVPSGNDAAVTLAEAIGSAVDPSTVTLTEEDIAYGDSQGVDIAAELSSGDAEQVFVALMNIKARAIGLTDTIFTNPHGLDGGDYGDAMHSNAADVITMAKTAMQSAEFRDLVDDPTVTITVRHDNGDIEELELESTDLLLGNYEGACGIKTGNTELAGPCLMSACQRNGTMLYAAVLDSSSEAQRFSDAQNLFNWYFTNKIDYPLVHASETINCTIDGQTRDWPVVAEVSHLGWPDKTVKATFEDPDETVVVFAMRGNVSQSIELLELTGNVNVGDVVGEATFYQDNKKIADTKLIACETVPAPNLFEGIGIWWDRLCRGVSGKEASAPSVIMNETPLIFDKAI